MNGKEKSIFLVKKLNYNFEWDEITDSWWVSCSDGLDHWYCGWTSFADAVDSAWTHSEPARIELEIAKTRSQIERLKSIREKIEVLGKQKINIGTSESEITIEQWNKDMVSILEEFAKELMINESFL